MSKRRAIISQQEIENSIVFQRGEKVLLDADLARFYGVSTKSLTQAVRRNITRFPADFAYRLTVEEFTALRSQIVTSKEGRGGRRYPPYVFTEQGMAMLASVLRSERAVQVNIEIVRAFVRLRKLLAVNADLAKRLDEVESRLGNHDEQFVQVIRAIRELMQPSAPVKRRKIGFHQPPDEATTTARARVRSRK